MRLLLKFHFIFFETGCFNIDPNRVLDIILEMFEKQLEHEKFFCELLTEYSADHLALADLLGFKFKYYVVC